jgi:serpin B
MTGLPRCCLGPIGVIVISITTCDALVAEELLPAQRIAAASNQIGCELYRASAAESSGNLALAATSVTMSLGMLRLGAHGDSARMLDERLNPGGDVVDLHAVLGRLVEHLDQPDGGVQWKSENRMWLHGEYTARREFVTELRDRYGADLVRVKFGRSQPARNAANEWVKRATQGQIEEIVPAGWLRHDTRFVLANATLLSAAWRYPFNPRQTKSANFHAFDGKERKVAMMSMQQMLRYSHPDGLHLVELPYQGQDLAMVIAVPDKQDGLTQIERPLSADLLAEWSAALYEPAGGEQAAGIGPTRGNWAQVTLSLPRFRIEADVDLTKALSGMGLAALFATETADLSGIATDAENLYVQGVLQAVRLEVDEAGTRLAAATSVKGGFGGGAREVTVTADHPFLFFVRDTRTGAVLVLGRLVE